jgi:RNA polymerase sigma-70 factor (ECF subfamily)
MPSDEALLIAWNDGDRRAGSRLLSRYFEPLYRFFRNKVDQGCDELIQETLVACVSGRDRLRDAPNFRAFVFGTARNVLFTHFRRVAKAERHLDFDAQSVAALGQSPSSVLARGAEHRLLAMALRAIPLEHQVALELFYWEELTGPELVAVLGVPEGTVRTRLRKGRRLLLRQLEQLADTPAVFQSTSADLDHWLRNLRAMLRDDG